MQTPKNTSTLLHSRLLKSWAVFALVSALWAGKAVAQIDNSPSSAAAGKPAEDQIVKMAPLQVTVGKDTGYKVTTSSGATRSNTPLIDIPQTVDIVTREMWNDWNATSWDQSFKYMANTYVRNRNAGGGDDINSRGFQTAINSIAVNGISVGDQHYKRDLVGYERLEIVKGPPSAVQGRAAGTAYYNYILKTPDLRGDFTDTKLIFGADEFNDFFYRAELDSNTTLDRAHTMGFRLAAAWQKSDDYIKFQRFSLFSLYPSFEWKPNSKTDIVWTNEILKSLTPSREEGHGSAEYGYKARILFPAYKTPTDPITALHLPYNFNILGRGEDAHERVAASTLFITHQFNDNISYRQALHWRSVSFDTQTFTAEDNSKTIINSSYTHTIYEWHNVTAQGDLSANYKWNWISESTLLGYNYRAQSANFENWTVVPNAPFNTINMAALAATGDSADYFIGRTVTLGPRTSYTLTKAYNLGAYVEEAIGLFKDRLLLNTSIRRDSDRSETDSLATGKETASTKSQLTSYRYGFTGKILPKLAFYAVVSLQNNPPVTYQTYSGLIAGDPRLDQYFTVSPCTKLYEYGFKGEALNGRLSFTAAHWQMGNTGTVINLMQNGLSQGQNVTFGVHTVLVGAESHGYELESFGSVTKRFSVIANYTRMYTSQQNSATPDQPGNKIALIQEPIWNFNFYGKYSFRDQKDQGWVLKAGIAMIGPLWTNQTFPTGAVPMYIPQSQKCLDAGVEYRWHRYDFGLTVSNLDNDAFLIMRDTPPRTYKFSVSTYF